MARAGGGGGRGGFALIGALWLLVILSVVGLEFALQARGMTARAINASDHAPARAAAEGCVAYARDVLEERLLRTQGLALGGEALLDPWQAPSRLLDDTVKVGTALCVAQLSDAGTRLHLNRASEEDLRRLLTALRVDAGDADQVAQAILDWRDLDGFRRARGGEAAEYVKDGSPVLPADGPFGSVDDVASVRGVTPRIYQRMAPFLTLAGSGRINLAAAPPEVIASLPGMSDDLLALILRARRSGAPVGDLLSLSADLEPAAAERLRRDLPALMARIVGETQEVQVTVEAWLPGSAARARLRAVVVRSGGSALLVERTAG